MPRKRRGDESYIPPDEEINELIDASEALTARHKQLQAKETFESAEIDIPNFDPIKRRTAITLSVACETTIGLNELVSRLGGNRGRIVDRLVERALEALRARDGDGGQDPPD